MRVAIKYCGSCNPQTDVAWIGRAIQARLEARKVAVVSAGTTDLDALVLICGCPRACIDRPEMRNRASSTVVVAGEMVDFVPTVESGIPTRVEQEVLEMLSTVTRMGDK